MPDRNLGRSLALERACPALGHQHSFLGTVNPLLWVTPFRLLSPCILHRTRPPPTPRMPPCVLFRALEGVWC